MISQEGRTIDYGLGPHPLEPLSPGQDPCWVHGGTVWGGGTPAMACADGGGSDASPSTSSAGTNWTRPAVRSHPVDAAPAAFHRLAANG